MKVKNGHANSSKLEHVASRQVRTAATRALPSRAVTNQAEPNRADFVYSMFFSASANAAYDHWLHLPVRMDMDSFSAAFNYS